MSTPPADQRERDLAVRWMDGPVLVEAGAGTGKTRLLVERVVHLVGSEGVPLGRIAAITFTIKAAAELRERIRTGLAAAVSEAEGDEGKQARLVAALEEIDRAQISTIHSFALALLRDRAVEAGLRPGAGEVDLLAHEELRDRLWEEWLAERLSGEEGALEEFLALGFTIQDLSRVRDALLHLPELREGFPRPEGARPEELKKEIQEAIAVWAGMAERCGDRTDKAYVQLLGVKAWGEGLSGESFPALLRGLWQEVSYKRNVGAAKAWGSKEAVRALHESFDRLVGGACARALAEAGHAVLAGAVGSLRGFVDRLERRAAEEGILNFEGILDRAARLARGSAEARRRFRGRFTHFLVDEFQDTDPLQVELIFLLAGEEPSPEDWRGARLRGGRLFLVGDPKQSIYRFRRADIAVYLEAKGVIERTPKSQVIGIRQNFRSAPGVIEFVNGVFGRLIAPEEEVQPGYAPLEPYRMEEGPGVLLLPEADGGDGEEEEGYRSREAASLAGAIRHLVEAEGREIPAPAGGRRPLRYGDVAVLFRTRTGYPEYEDAFRRAGVPFLSEGGRRFYDRMEVAAAAAVLRAVVRPCDPLALAAALRSPLYGFSDADLARFLLPELPSPPEVERAAEEMRELSARRAGMGARAMIEEIFRRTQAYELFLAASHGEQRVGNLLKLLDLAFAFEGGGARGVDEFGAFLDAQIARGDEAREPEAVVLEGEAVRFMTIYGAKGLEFPVVALADLGGKLDPDKTPWAADRGRGGVEIRLGSKDRPLQSRGYAVAREREDAFQAAELKRLLYVAATRARELLIWPLFPGSLKRRYKNLWDHLRQAGAGEEAMRSGALGPAAEFREPLPPAREEEGILRIPEAVFEPDEGRIEEGRRRRAALVDRLRALAAPTGRRRPLAPSQLVGPDGGGEEDGAAERYGLTLSEAGEGPRGRAFGRLVHALLAGLEPPLPGRAEELAGEARALALELGLGEEEAGEALSLIRRAADGELLRRAAAAPRRWRELPFFALAEGRLLRGFADLVFEEGEDLILCDFKTDRVAAAEVPARAEHYLPQGAAYALGVEQAAGRRVREVVFSFLRPGVDRALPVDEALLGRAREAVRLAG